MPEPARLLDVTATAVYLGDICTDSVRALVAAGHLVPVRLPSTRRPGESSRRLLFAREDLDALIDKWKRASTGRTERAAQRGRCEGVAADAGAEARCGVKRGAARRDARCIATPTFNSRCTKAAITAGGLYVCHEHLVAAARSLLDQYHTAETREVLANRDWETFVEGQAAIDEFTGQRRKT